MPKHQNCATSTGFIGAACYKTINPVTGEALHFKSDSLHLIKNLRGAFLVSWAKQESSVRQLQKGGGKISFGFIKEIWQREQGRIYKETKLTAECIYPNNFQKMSVPLAARIFQMPVVRELKAIKSEERAKAPAHDPARIKDLQATIDFVSNAGRCFEIQNCLGFGAAKCKQQLRVGYEAVVRRVWLCSPGQTPVRGAFWHMPNTTPDF